MRAFSITALLAFIFLLFLASSCLTVQKLNSSLEQPQIDISLDDDASLPKPFPSISIPKGIELDSVFYPSGLVPQSFSTRSGVIIIPLLIYNRFQSNYLVTLGAKQFQQPINEAFKSRFQTLLTTCEDSTRLLTDHRYKLTMDLQSCQTEGIYVHGTWGVFYLYGTISGVINRGRNASSFVRIRWELSDGNEPVVGGNVMVTLKDSYLGSANGFLTTNGQRKELTKSDLNFGIPFQIQSGNDPYSYSLHMNQLTQVLCLSLDEASETILKDLEVFFKNFNEVKGN